nr:MAG TPA: hypothetical protein [Caudoviricetes sp.]DAI04361.1 MAG TPA: hypothetical protein [Caudoviricetes sp.]
MKWAISNEVSNRETLNDYPIGYRSITTGVRLK